MMTTLSNIQAMERAISVEELPQTFRDAVRVTQMLGLDYIWIDSLCIIQDSEKDWSEQAPQTGEIYGNAFITISADVGANSHSGLFGQNIARNPAHAFACPGEGGGESAVYVRRKTKRQEMYEQVSHWHDSDATVEEVWGRREWSHLESRAWTFQ